MNNPGLCYSLFIKTSGLCYTEIIHTDLYHRYENIYFLKKRDVNSASDAIYSIHIKTLFPLHSVSATINGTPVRLQEEGSKEFKAAVSDNGTLKIKAVSFDSYSKDGYVYLKVMDTYSGIDYPNIGGYAPDHFDTKTGNELVLLLSPVDNN